MSASETVQVDFPLGLEGVDVGGEEWGRAVNLGTAEVRVKYQVLESKGHVWGNTGRIEYGL